MENYDPIGTPMETVHKLDLEMNGSPVDATKYRTMIGSLMYLTSSRWDIVHATTCSVPGEANREAPQGDADTQDVMIPSRLLQEEHIS
ncbi:hypothetical protein Tco_0682166 [Tanacetum coccineum]|uniref:Gag-pol polyprotein n=1 Tax=Tanacetum coccineum TaxID=301880 RepID=A0ABQ4XS02_9ASTR